MFWRVAGFSQPSPIATILDKDEFTLEELLDEDDIVQECKALYEPLIAFLKGKPVVEKLLRYLISPPNSHELDGDGPKRQFQYSYTACELFCCDVEPIYDTLLSNDDLMALLFSLLDAEPPLDCMTAGYFGRVVGHLLLRKVAEMEKYLQQHSSLLTKLINHIGTTSIQEIVLKLVGADDALSIMFSPQHLQWLADGSLIELLLTRFQSSDSSEAQANAGEVLAAIAHTQPSVLASKLASSNFMDALLQSSLQPGSQLLLPAIGVCIALLEPKLRPADIGAGDSQHEPRPVQDDALRRQAVSGIVAHLKQLTVILQQEDPAIQSYVPMPYGLLKPPLGLRRLKVVELLATLAGTGEPVALLAIKESGMLHLIMDFFIQYPFNNLLHLEVLSLFSSILNHLTDDMATYLATACDLFSRLSRAPMNVTVPGITIEDDSASARTNGATTLRAGYHGHVTQLADRIAKVAATHPKLQQLLASNDAWNQFMDSEVRLRIERENIQDWQCGRPNVAELSTMNGEGQFQEEIQESDFSTFQGESHRYNQFPDMDEEEDDFYEDVHDVERVEDLDGIDEGVSDTMLVSVDGSKLLSSFGASDQNTAPHGTFDRSFELRPASDSSSDDSDDEASAPLASSSAPVFDDDDVVVIGEPQDTARSGMPIPARKSPAKLAELGSSFASMGISAPRAVGSLASHVANEPVASPPETQGLLPKAPPARTSLDVADEEQRKEYNSFNYWKADAFAFEIPDDA